MSFITNISSELYKLNIDDFNNKLISSWLTKNKNYITYIKYNDTSGSYDVKIAHNKKDILIELEMLIEEHLLNEIIKESEFIINN